MQTNHAISALLHHVRQAPKAWGPALFCGTQSQRNQEASSINGTLASSRLMGRIQQSMSDKGKRHSFLNIVWDSTTSQFKVRQDIYDNYHSHKDSYERQLHHATLLSDDFVAGAIVDQVGKRITLPDGRWIDGPTGNIYNVHGELILQRKPETTGLPDKKDC